MKQKFYLFNLGAFVLGIILGFIVPSIFPSFAFLGIIYIHGDEDYSDTGVDFIVQVPNDIIFNINEMKGLIDFYKLASKRYKIINHGQS